MNNEHFGLAQVLMSVFPGHPERHIAWIPGGEPGDKRTTLRHYRAGLAEFSRHLHPASREGVGAVGIVQGIKTKRAWRTPWAVLDFDEQKPAELEEFFHLLRSRGLNFLFNTGTRERGTHVFFLLDTAVTLHQAHKALTLLEGVAKRLGAGLMDLRPNSGRPRPDKGLYLPYRGAGDDGFGANPLVDSATGVVISLAQLPDHPRQPVAAFTALTRLKSAESFIAGPARSYRPERLPHLESVIPLSTDRWAAELERLADFWTKGRRYHLTLAATAYGLHRGVLPDQIVIDLLNLAEDKNDEELQDRRSTIQDSLKRAAEGEPMAYHQFYEAADVPSPEGGTTAAVREQVEEMLDALMADPWKGKGGKTDRSLLKTLLSLAWKYGYEHDDGVEVSAAWSTLEQGGSIGSSSTMSLSLSRLEGRGWTRRGLNSHEGKSGSFILLVEERSTLFREGPSAEDYFGLSPSLRYGYNRDTRMKRLGKSAEHVIDVLMWFGPLTRKELAAHMDVRPTDQRELLGKLCDERILEVDDCCQAGKLRVSDRLDHFLEDHQERDGSKVAASNQAKLHKDKTERFKKMLESRRNRLDQTATTSDSGF